MKTMLTHKKNTECTCYFCKRTDGVKVISSIYLPKNTAVCNECYNVGRIALDNCTNAIKVDQNKDNTYTVYKVDAFGKRYNERNYKRWTNAKKRMQILAKLYLD